MSVGLLPLVPPDGIPDGRPEGRRQFWEFWEFWEF
jgi:hypothetical protein